MWTEWRTICKNDIETVLQWRLDRPWHGMACIGAGGSLGENVRDAYRISDIFTRGGRMGCLEGLEWGEKGVLEGKRGGLGLFGGCRVLVGVRINVR